MKTLRRHRRILNSLLAFLVVSWQIGQPLQAATLTWTGTTDATWNTATNWSGGVPTAADDAVFGTLIPPTGASITLAAGSLANSLLLSNDYTLNGGDLTLTGGGIRIDRGQWVNLNSQLSGTSGLTLTGGGSLRLSNDLNDYTGTTTVANGTLVISSLAQLGASTSAVVVTVDNPVPGSTALRGYGAGSLYLDGSAAGINFTRDLSLQGRGPINDNGAALVSLGNNTLAGAINLNTPTTGTVGLNTRLTAANGTLTLAGPVNIAGTAGTTVATLGGANQAGPNFYQFTGSLSGTGTLDKSGGGTLFFNPSSTATFNGTLRVSGSAANGQSTVRITSSGVLGNRTANSTGSVIDMNGGILEVRMDSPVFTVNTGAAANVYQRASSTMVADHAPGGATVNGTVTFGEMPFEDNLTTTFNSRNGYSMTFSAAPVVGSTAGDNNTTLANNLAGTLTFTGNFWSNANNTGNRTLTFSGNGNSVLAGNLIASAAAFDHSLSKSGSGSLTITSVGSTLDGAVNISGGAVVITDFRSITNNTATVNIGSGGTAGALIIGTSVNPTAAGLTTSKVMNLAGTTGGATIFANQAGINPVVLNAPFTATAGTSSNAKTLTLGGTSTVDNIINGAIPNNAAGGLVNLLKVGAGTWVLAGENTFTGTTTIANGALKIKANAASSTVLPSGAAITFNNNNGYAGGSLEFIGQPGVTNSQSLGVLTTSAGSGTIRLTPGVAGTASLTFSNLATSAGATVDFVGGDTVNNTFTLNQINGAAGTDGLVSRTIYWNGADFAYRAGGLLRAPVYGTDAGFDTSASALTAGSNNQITGSFSTNTVSVNTLKIAGSQTLTLNAAQTLTLAGGGLLATGGNAVITGGTALALGGNALVARVNQATDVLRIESPITGTAGLTKAGLGTLVLAGNNAQTGTFSLNEGTIQLASGGRLGAAGTTVTIRQGAVLDLNGIDSGTAIGQFNNNGRVTNTSASPAILTVGNSNGTGTSWGVIDETNGVIHVTKIGTGAQTWVGTSNYSGVTTIGGSTASLITVDTLADHGQPSGIGTGSAQGNAASLVFDGTGGGLVYAGTNRNSILSLSSRSASTDRLFTLSGSSATLSSTVSNNNAIVWSNPGDIVHGTVAARTLILTGTSQGENILTPRLTDSGTGTNITSLTKTGTGMWRLNGANTYTGATLVQQGILMATDGVGLPSASNLVLDGGTLYSQGSLNRPLGTGAGQMRFAAAAANTAQFAGGFLGGDSKLTVDWGSGHVWGSTTNFLSNRNGLLFNGSQARAQGATGSIALSEVELVSGFSLGTATGSALSGLTYTLAQNSATISGLASTANMSVGQPITGTNIPVGAYITSINSATQITISANTANTSGIAGTYTDGATAANPLRPIRVDDNGNTGADFATISGVITGNAGTGIRKLGAGILRLTGANTYSGETNVFQGSLVVNSLGNSASPGVGTSVGTSTNANLDSNAVTLGNGVTGAGILQYVGPGETSDRKIRLNTTTGSVQIHADGVGPLVLSNLANDMAGGNKTLFLRGTNTGANQITSQLSDNGGTLGVTIDGGALWVFTNPLNDYTGNTTVSAGALGIGHDSALGTGTLIFNNGSILGYGGDRSIAQAISQSNNTTTGFIGDYSLTFSNTLALLASANNVGTNNNLVAGKALTFGAVTANNLTANRTWAFDGAGLTVINGPITTSTAFGVAISKTGNGTLVVGGTGSNFNQNGANIDVDRGTLRMAADNVIASQPAVAGPPAIAASGGLILSPEIATSDTATFDLNGTSQTVNALTATTDGTAVIDNTSALPASLTFGANDAVVNFGSGIGSYSIQNSGGGALSIIKTGSTSTTFSAGMTLSYTGETAVTGGSFTIASALSGTSGLRAVNASSLALTGGLTNPNLITSVEVGGGSTLSLLDGTGSKLNLQSLSLGNSGTGTVTLNLNIGDLNVAGDFLSTDTLTLLTGGTLQLGNSVTFNLTDAGLSANTTYTLLNLADGGLTAFGSGNLIQGATPGGFDGFTWNVTNNLVQITTGNLILGDIYWRGLTSTAWNGNANNWSTDKAGTTPAQSIPGQGNRVIFAYDNIGTGALTTTLEQNFKVGGLVFEAGATTPASVTINTGTNTTSRIETGANGIAITTGGPAAVTLAAAVKVGADQTWSVADAGSTLTLGSLFGEADITVSGAGRIVLNAAADPTFNAGATSDFVLNGGNLELQNVGALGTPANANTASITVNTGAGFYYNGTAGTVSNPITLSGGSLSAGTATQTYNGTVNVSSASFINLADSNGPVTNAARSITLSGLVTGSGSLTIDGNNTASSGNQIGGTLTINNAAASWNGDLFFNRGTVTISNTASLTAIPGNVTFNSFGRLILGGVDGRTLDRAGTLNLAAGAVGEFQLDNVTTTQVTDFTVNQNGAVNLGASGTGASLRVALVDAFAKLNLTGPVNLGGNSSISVSNSAARLLTLSGIIGDGGAGYGLAINDDAGGWAQTNGTVRLTGPNTFSGNLTVDSGILEFSTVTNIGGAASNLGQGGAITLGAANLNFIGDTSQSTDRPITTTAAAILSANGTGGASITYAGAINVGPTADGTQLTLTGAAGRLGFITGGINQTGDSADLSITGGTWTHATGTSRIGDNVTVSTINAVLNLDSGVFGVRNDFTVTTGANLYLNGTGVLSYNIATLSADSTLRATAGGVIHLGANDAVNPTEFDGLRIGVDADGDTAVLNMGAFNQTVTEFLLGNRQTTRNGVVNGTGTLTVTGNLDLYEGTFHANLASTGTSTLEKIGPGTVTFRGDNSGLTSTGNTVLHAGLLALDYTASNSAKLRAGSALDMRGSALRMTGNASAATSQTVNGLTLTNLGHNVVEVIAGAGQDAVLNLGGITRATAVGTVRFVLPAGVQSASNGITTSAAVTNGLLGTGSAFATVKDGTGTWFATVSGGNVVAATSTVENSLAAWTSGSHLSDGAGGFTGTTGGLQIGSLRFDAAGGSNVNLTPVTGLLDIRSGGILVTDNVTAGTPGIFGGRLQAASGELILTHDSARDFQIGSSIVGGTRLLKAGSGTVLLTGTNVNGDIQINEGTLRVAGGRALSDTARVLFALNRQAELELLADETIGRLEGGRASTGEELGIVDVGSHTLSINQSDNDTTANESITYAGTFEGDGTVIKRGVDYLILNGNSSQFTGAFIVDNGRLDLAGGLGRLSSASAYAVNAGSTLLIRQDQSSTVDRMGNSASITLNNTSGTLMVAGREGLWLYNTQNGTRTEDVGALILGAGHNQIRVEPQNSGTSTLSDLLADTLIRENRATVAVNGINLGASTGRRGRLRFDAAGVLTVDGYEVGAGSNSGTQFKIIPWVVGNLTNSGVGNTFVTYDGANGLRPLATTEYITDAAGFNGLTGAATDNVRFATNPAGALTGTATSINSLLVDSAAVTLTGPASSLEISSGAMLFTGNFNHVVQGFTGLTTGGGLDYTIYHTGAAANSVTINSPLTSSVPLVKSGTGTLVLTSDANAFTDVYANQGFIQVNDYDKLGSGNLNFFGGGLRLASGFTDDLAGKSWVIGTGGGVLDTNGNTTVNATDWSVSGAGTLRKQGVGTLNLSGSFGGGFTGLFVVGQEMVTLNFSSSNAFGTGGILINGGTATPSTGLRLLAADQIADSATVTLSTGGTNNQLFDLNGFNESIGGLVVTSASTDGATVRTGAAGVLTVTGDIAFNNDRSADASTNEFQALITGSGNRTTRTTDGFLDLGGATRTISVNSVQTNTSFRNDAVIETVIQNGGLIKTGTRALFLRADNTYAGGTTVLEGALVAANTSGSATGTGSVTIARGGILAGNGILAPAADNSITVDGTLLIGGLNDGARQLTLTTTGTGLTTVNGVVAFDLFSGQGSGTLNASTQNDQLVVNGANGFAIGSGATLQVTTSLPIDGSWVAGTEWKLFDWAGLSGGVTGTFSNLADPAPFNHVNLPDLSSIGLAWDVSNLYTAGTIMVVVPEPGRMLLVFLGLLGLFFRRRR